MQNRHNHQRHITPVLLWCAVALGLAGAGPAFGQIEALEEVTVTAQRREQSALEVPMTVNVFSAAEIEKTGALDLPALRSL